jgi:pyrroline-5-carboxylate reductase
MKIGFIGVGKITNAIVEGLCTASIQTKLFLSPRNENTARHLAEKYGNVARLKSNQEVIDQSQIIFIAVRPAAAKEVLQPLVFREDQIVVSLVPLMK